MNRPRVITFSIASADGRITLSRDTLLLYGDPRWASISGKGYDDIYKEVLHRCKPQATLEGSGSFIRDVDQFEPLPPTDEDPKLLRQDFLPAKILERPGHRGWFTAVDGGGRIRWMYKEYPDEQYAGWYALSLVSAATPCEHLAFLRREEIPYLVAGQERVDLPQALEKMKTSLGVETIVSTAGGRLNGALLRAGLVDEIHIVTLPGIIGGQTTPALFSSPDLLPDESPIHLALDSVERVDQLVWTHYFVSQS